MRVRELTNIHYRSTTTITDAHGNKVKVFSDELSTLIGSIRPETLTTDVKDSGSIVTGNILVYVPRNKNPKFDVKQGDGFYLDGEDTDGKPTWIVSNLPFPYIKHYLLVLKNKVE